jgi:hypothetical protein
MLLSLPLSVVLATHIVGLNGSVDQAYFVDHVAPILERSCVGCHRGVAARGKLALDTRAGMLRGGESGPAIAPGDSSASLLLEMVRGDEPPMPQDGPPLSPAEIEVLTQWVDAGAPWVADQVLQDRRDGQAWWSLSELVRPPLPTNNDLSHPIDRFIAAKLAEHGLAPAAAADRRMLIRRLTFDLHGLPPTPAEVQQFVFDTEPSAYEKLVDRLLASPRYGEHWARHWLDIVHYGDTHGYDKDKPRRHAWRYRDFVIDAFNSDLPYAEFVARQIAADALHPDDPQAVAATGFIAAGPWDFVGHVELREDTVEKAKTRSLDRDDMVANTMSTFTSLTVHCARCHDHAFDPISQRDYYRLQAVFAGVERQDVPCEAPEITAQRRSLQADVQAAEKSLAELAEQITQTNNDQQRAPLQAQHDQLTAQRDDLRMQLAALPEAKLVYAVASRAPRAIHLLERGNVEKPGPEVTPGGLACLSSLLPDLAPAGTGEPARRAALAQWITDRRNPLTWRSIVNRVWHYHFGRGLVDTPSDFGRKGSRPTHPELLDWLAVEFRDGDQSLKNLHRLIVTSRTYRQASEHHAHNARIDAGNRDLWRMNRRRLTAEEIRDAILAISGKLDLTMGGPGFELFKFRDDHSPRYDPISPDRPDVWRRAVYRFITRSVPNPWMESLDCPDPSLPAPVRTTTITALQALSLLNDDFVFQQSRYLAARLAAESPDLASQIERAFLLCFARPPSRDELLGMSRYVSEHGLAPACRLLFNTNEFVFVD